MTRVLMGVAMLLWAGSASPVMASNDPDIRVVREAGGATITLRAGTLRVTQTLSRAALQIEIAQEDDVMRFAGDLEGRVSIERGGRRHSFLMRTGGREDQMAFNNLANASRALAAFDTLLQSPWGRTAPAARAFSSTRELIRVVQGEAGTVGQMSAPPPAMASLAPVKQRLSPSQCWDTYARDVTKFTYDLQSCLGAVYANWWNPLHTAWCAYEYNLKSSLAAIWLLDCYGVPV